MLPTVMLAISMQGISPQTQMLPVEMLAASSHYQTQVLTSVFNPLTPQVEKSTSVFNTLVPQNAENMPKTTGEDILDTAKKQIGVRYVWGGTSRGGFDCSGFVQYVFEKNDIELPRTSREQWKVGKFVYRSELETGDLIFFKTRNSRVSHVGIYKGNNMFIHASSTGGKIRVNELTGYYANKYAGAKRILDDTDVGI